MGLSASMFLWVQFHGGFGWPRRLTQGFNLQSTSCSSHIAHSHRKYFTQLELYEIYKSFFYRFTDPILIIVRKPGIKLFVVAPGAGGIYDPGTGSHRFIRLFNIEDLRPLQGCGGRRGVGDPIMADSMAQEILSAHNKYRAEVGVPPLEWSDDLTNHAQEWANYLSANLLFQHSGVSGEGENIWMGTLHAYSFTQMIDSFGNEKQHFIYGVFPNVSDTGNWRDVAHYTQIVWRNTKQVGCAGADGADGNYRLVCRYSPPGNVEGEPPF
jgi:hypothetical protein